VNGERSSRFPIYAAIAFLIVIIVIGWWWWFGQPTTVLLVRHAEKAANPVGDPPLTTAGQDRAQSLVHVAGAAGVTGVFASEFQRTQLTAQPLATSLGLTPVEVSAGDPGELADQIFASHRGQTVLVAGHSNTVPQVIEELVGSSICPDLFALDPGGDCVIPDSQFDNLLVVTIPRWGARRTVRLRYGSPTP